MEPVYGSPFFEDIYLYDLNCPEASPPAYRSAHGGREQPDLLSLIGLPVRAWRDVAAQLYDRPVYLSVNGGVILLPVQGSIGRFVLAVKTSLSLPALAYVTACAGKNVYADREITQATPGLQEREREAAEHAVHTLAALDALICACESARSPFDAQECIDRAAGIMGVSLMPPEKAEAAPMKGQGLLPEMQHEGQVMLVCMLTLLSVMRNRAHARSGWLYATPCDHGYALQAYLRSTEDADLGALAYLRTLLENGDVVFGTRSFVCPIKPPKQYAYLHRKITDPRKPLCARCQCLDARCATCTATAWAILPYVCDAALLGIKTLPRFEA